MTTYEPGTYIKGDDVRSASNAAEAVALAFQGYKRQTADFLADVDYRDLQEQAKALGIPANQSKEALAEAITAAPAAAPGPAGGPDFPAPQSMLDGETVDEELDESSDEDSDES